MTPVPDIHSPPPSRISEARQWFRSSSSRPSVSAVEFVEAVARLRLPSVFNPYSDKCPHFDMPDATARRRSNLQLQLQAAIDLEVDTVWVGRDLGYRGGRRTGIALTDEANLASVRASFGDDLRISRATIGPATAERTAAVVWRMMRRLNAPVFTWNVFPLHPHELLSPLTNRCHTRKEREFARPILLKLIELLRPSRIVAIGNDAAAGLAEMGIDCLKVRHPSYGGISDFQRGIAKIHGLSPDVEDDHLIHLL